MASEAECCGEVAGVMATAIVDDLSLP